MFWKFVKLIPLAIITFLIGCAIYAYFFYFHYMYMTPKMIQRAEVVLANGITVEDGKDDFVMMGTNKEEPNENNPSPYRVPYLDIKSIQLGADEKYIYFKTVFQEPLPKRPGNIDGDYFQSIGSKLSLTDSKGVEQVILGVDTAWMPVIHLPGKSTYYSWGPTGIEWPENARFAHEEKDSKVGGGMGTNYVLGALPLEHTGLKIGDITYFQVSEETRSDKYTHAAVDILLGEGKMPALIEWKVGSSSFKIIDTPWMK